MPVTGAFKERLMGALHTAVQQFNECKDPNEAVVKAAKAHDFNADQAARLVETFNTARTIYHYKTADDRSSSFALAEPGVVIPTLFKEDTQKKAAVVHNHDYSDYDIPEAEYRNGMEIKSGAGVHEPVDLGRPTEYMDTNLDTLAERAYKIIHTQKDLAKTARDEGRVAATKAAQVLSKLAAELGRGYIEQRKDIYARLVGGYTDEPEYGPVVSKLAEFVHPELAATPAATDVVIDDRDLGGFLGQMKEAKYWMEAEAEMLAMAGQLEKEANAFERDWLAEVLPIFPRQEVVTVADFIEDGLRKGAQAVKSGQTTITRTEEKPLLTGEGKVQRVSKQTIPSLFGTFEEATTSGIQEGIKRPIAAGVESAVESLMSAPTEYENQALSERIKNVQRQLMMEDLLTNDPVLSEENPDTVVKAYQAVLNLAPELAANKEVVRAILRQTVHSVAISPYEAEVWTKLEQNIRNIAGKADTRGRPVEAGQGGGRR